ncbi:hypothetical protein [Bradyrhizobium sp. Tv2a-2]|uniref:hypothetical protein n=1 Tax=Bradyrhizobium sp. Tv2a-2 TaxID=113395 RepID=UPI0004278577|nr:hypothetical protein [Bradyrhizobium sp. Tv2a-2]
MSIPVHTVQVLDSQSGSDFFDRMILGQKIAVAVPNGSSTQTVAVTFVDALPQVYSVFASFNTTGLTYFITSKSSTGFTLNVTGTTSSTTADILVVAA